MIVLNVRRRLTPPCPTALHLRFVPMQDQEAAAAQKRAAAEKLNVVHECTNQCAQVGFYNN